MKTRFLTFIIILIITTLPIIGQAQIPRTLSYQGVLSDETGSPKPDGSYTLTFNLYDTSAGGAAIWTETKTLEVIRGLFHTALGDEEPFGASVEFDEPYWLGILVAGEPELSPRIPLTSVGYSFSSLRADTALFALSAAGGAGGGHSLDADDGYPTDAVYVDSVGNVGIGTTSPIAKLSVNNAAYGDALTVAGASSTGWGGNIKLMKMDNGFPMAELKTEDVPGWGCKLHFYTQQTGSDASDRLNNAMTIDNDGNVGIGTTSPEAVLHLESAGSGANEQELLRLTREMANMGIRLLNYDGTGTVESFRLQSTNNLATWSDIMSFDPVGVGIGIGYIDPGSAKLAINGNVGIGTTSPEAKLHVNGEMRITGILRALKSDGGYPVMIGVQAGEDILQMGSNAWNGLQFDVTGSGGQMFIDNSGNVGIGTTSPDNILTVVQSSATDPIADAWTTYSSRRWKTNIRTIENALDKVEHLHGVTYDWKADGKHDIGLIAEEVGEVIPEVVAYEENGIDAKSVDYARLVAVLIEAVKEQQNTIEHQTAEIESLKEKMTRFESSLRTLEDFAVKQENSDGTNTSKDIAFVDVIDSK